MSKNMVSVTILFVGIAFTLATGTCLADMAGQLEQAGKYQKNGHLSQAEQLYKGIAEGNPGTGYAFEAYKALAFLYIRTEQTGAATQIISRLASDYSAHTDLPKALSDLARNSAKRRAYEQAKSIYEQLAQQFPAYAYGAAVGIAKVDIMFQIESSRYAQAEVAVGALITDFAGNSALPEALYDIAGRYGTNRKYKEAKNIYQLIVQQYPSSDFADKSPLDIARIEVISLIRAGLDTQAAAAIDKLCEDFVTSPGLPKALYIIAGRYRGWAKYDKAMSVFQKVIERCPASSYVDKARLNIARCNVLGLIKAGKYAESAAAYAEMITEFSGRLGLQGALNEIAGRYEQAEQYKLARQVYGKIAVDYPGSTYTLESQKQLIYMQIGARQFSEGQQAIAAFAQDFAGHAKLPQTLNDIGTRFNYMGGHQQAESYFQQVAQQYPNTPEGEEAQVKVVKSQILSLIKSGQTDAGFAATEKLVTDFRGNYFLPWALSRIAEQYCRKAVNMFEQNRSEAQKCFQQAITLYEEAASNSGDSRSAASALCGLGRCYRKMGDYEKAQQSFTKVVNDYPRSDLAKHALFLLGRTYEKMGKTGRFPEQQALAGAKIAYQRLLEEYPDCKMASIARDRLSHHDSN